MSFSETGKEWEGQVWGAIRESSLGSGEVETLADLHCVTVLGEAARSVSVSYTTTSSERARLGPQRLAHSRLLL